MNADTGAHSLVFLLTMKPMPTPQSGWQPHFSVPQSAPGPWSRSVTSDIALEADSGNQSRSGSVTPVWRFMSSARCDKRVALGVPLLVGDVLVAAGERHRLKRDEADLVAVLQRELHDRPDLIVVDGVDDRHDQADVDAGGVQVLDGAQLDVEQVADLAVRVGLLGHAVELQVGDPHAGLARLARELRAPARSGCRWWPPGR